MSAAVRAAAALALLVPVLAASPARAQHAHGDGSGEGRPPWSQADEYFDSAEMAHARAMVRRGSGGQNHSFLMADRLEIQSEDGEDTFAWDVQGWYGGDRDKVWVKSEGHHDLREDEWEEADIDLLWSRAATTFFDWQTGLRWQAEPEELAYAVVGVQGLAPYWFEVDFAAAVSEDGDLGASLELEYELLLTQRLVLQPRIEARASAQRVPELETGSGLVGLEAGLRLRYEIVREFAPYVGIEWHEAFGETAGFIREASGDPRGTVFVAGLRAWF